MVGCSKFDDLELYRRKLAQIFMRNQIESLEVVYMEVPCCLGLVRVVQFALKESGRNLPLTLTKVGIQGAILDSFEAKPMPEKEK